MKDNNVYCILHGALNNTNFGDYLFGSLFFKKASEIRPDSVLIADMRKYGVSELYRKEMGYSKKCGIKGFLHADTLVYISGGYFGEMTSDAKNAIKRYLRYFLIGRIAMALKKRILIIGVGGGPLHERFLRNTVCRIINYADAVTFRDSTTLAYFSKFIDCTKCEVTSDTALVINKSMIPDLDATSERELRSVISCPKKILIHIADHQETDHMLLKIIDPINQFLAENQDYGVVFTYDGYADTPIDSQPIISLIKAQSKAVYHYHGVWQLCSVISHMDCIVTGKLHMGIVASRLGKSVLSFPYNIGKVKRFYEQINEPERCQSLKNVTPDDIYKLLTKYAKVGIQIPKEILDKANRNIEVLQYELKQ